MDYCFWTLPCVSIDSATPHKLFILRRETMVENLQSGSGRRRNNGHGRIPNCLLVDMMIQPYTHFTPGLPSSHTAFWVSILPGSLFLYVAIACPTLTYITCVSYLLVSPLFAFQLSERQSQAPVPPIELHSFTLCSDFNRR